MTTAHKQETMVLKISMYACLISVLFEFLVAIFSSSQSVLMDSVYDGSEFIMIFITMRLLPLLYKPISEKRPYGYGQVESILVVVKSFMMIAVTIGLVINNIQIMINGGNIVEYGMVAYFQLFLGIISFIVLFAMKKVNKSLDSPIITTEMNGWTIDAVSSLGMSIAFFIPLFFDNGFVNEIAPYLDQIIAILLSVFILPMPLKVLVTGFRDVFLFAPEPDTMDKIKELAEPILIDHNIDLTHVTYDIIRTGRKLWICIYFIPINDMISISRLSMIQNELELKLAIDFSDIYVELLPDIQ